MHEQSETVQDPWTGQWLNIFGRKTPKAGQVLPGEPEYDTVEQAVAGAKKRSQSHHEPALPTLTPKPSTEQYINQLVQDYDTPFAAFMAAKAKRDEVDAGKTGAARDLNLRNAEHALFSNHMMNELGTVGGGAALAVSVPAYSAAKLAAQKMPKASGIPAGIRALSGWDLSRSTKPDLSELYWGLRPIWSQIKKPQGKVSGLSEFAPQ
jgi:hypothetical protein